MLASKTGRADALAVVSEEQICIKLVAPIRLYRLKHGHAEPLETKLLDDIDQEAYEKAFNAYQRGDRRALKTIITEAVRKWVENRGGKLLAVHNINGDLQFLIKSM
ncbi:MAG: hypothetical protein QW074_06665 [Candidatus Caldarchaeum sp.]